MLPPSFKGAESHADSLPQSDTIHLTHRPILHIEPYIRTTSKYE